MLPLPSPPRGHITHLLEQTLHKVAILAGSRKRQVLDKLGSAADGQAGRWGGQAAPRREPRSPASSRGLGVPAGVRPQPGPFPVYLETSSPLPLRLPGEL